MHFCTDTKLHTVLLSVHSLCSQWYTFLRCLATCQLSQEVLVIPFNWKYCNCSQSVHMLTGTCKWHSMHRQCIHRDCNPVMRQWLLRSPKWLFPLDWEHACTYYSIIKDTIWCVYVSKIILYCKGYKVDQGVNKITYYLQRLWLHPNPCIVWVEFHFLYDSDLWYLDIYNNWRPGDK